MTDRSRLPTVAVDLDGTLAEYHGWLGIDHIGPPRPGAVNFIRELSRTHYVVLHTARLSIGEHRDTEEFAQALLRVSDWLEEHDFAVDEIHMAPGKPIAVAYVDDRAVHVPTNPLENDFHTALSTIRGGH